MISLDERFREVRAQLGHPATLNPAKSDPIFYFVYPVAQMLKLKRRLPIWATQLRNEGFDVVRISFSEVLWQLIDESGRYEGWLELEAGADVEQLNEAVRDVLRAGDRLAEVIGARIERASDRSVV